jgi:ABC-type glycerol-3-phosphate transport system permease component
VVTSFNATAAAVATMKHTQQIKVPWGPLGVVGVAMALPVILSMLGLRTQLTTGLTAGGLQGQS